MKKRMLNFFVFIFCLIFITNVPGVLAKGMDEGIDHLAGDSNENIEFVSQVSGFVTSVTVDDHSAYISDWSAQNNVRVINISDLENPTQTGACESEGSSPQDIVVQGDYAYIADDDGLTVITSDPGNPTMVGNQYVSLDSYGVAVSGNYAFLANAWGIFTIDVSTPYSPTKVPETTNSNFGTLGYAMDVEVIGDNLYTLSDYAILYILNITNPITPTLMRSIDLSGEAYDVEISGNYAYIANYYQGLSIVDISNPITPSLVSTTDTPGIAHGVAVSGNYVYVADLNNGVIVYNISNPVHPTQVGYYDTPGSAWNLTVSGNYIFVADKNGGLVILRFTPSYDYEAYIPIVLQP